MMSFENKGSVASTIVVSLSPDLTGNYVCSGAADEVEINLALAEALRRGGGRVLLLQGMYTLAASIVFPGNSLVLQGMGRATFIDGDALETDNHGIVISARTDCTVRDLSIQTADGGQNTCHCIFIEDNANRFLIENVWIVDSDSDGIKIEGADILDGWILNCKILDTDDYGILISMDGGSYIRRLHIKDNAILSSGVNGILAIDLVDCEIYGNVVTGALGDGIELNLCTDCSVNDNHSYGNVGHGIFLVNCDYNLIEGNECHDNDVLDTATYDGIHLDSASTTNIVSGNICVTNHRYGMNIDGALNIVVGNHLFANDRHGIYHDGLNSKIDNNFCSDNGVDANNTYDGIYLGANADFSTVSNNTCLGNDARQRHGIYVGNGAIDLAITGNICSNNASDGIHLAQNNDDCLITDNQLISNVDDGIEIAAASCNNNHVKDNYFNGNGGNALVDTGTDTATPFIYCRVVDPNANIGTHPAVLLEDDTDTDIYDQIHFPNEFQELVTAHVIVVSAASGDMVWTLDTNWGKLCASEDYNVDTDTDSGVDTLTISDIECVDIAPGFTNIAAGDLVGVNFMRDGDSVDDTINDVVYYLGIRVRYV